MLEETAGNIVLDPSPTTEQNDSHVNPMEDDSRSGNCSYDADASNDSIELNLSLDEQQPFMKQSHNNHMQTNNLPVSILPDFSSISVKMHCVLINVCVFAFSFNFR